LHKKMYSSDVVFDEKHCEHQVCWMLFWRPHCIFIGDIFVFFDSDPIHYNWFKLFMYKNKSFFVFYPILCGEALEILLIKLAKLLKFKKKQIIKTLNYCNSYF
jgi:hypothetical protein